MATLNKWHEELNKNRSRYIFANFIFFPIISWLILLFVVAYFNTFAPNARIKKFEQRVEGKNEEKILDMKYQLQIEFSMSTAFVLYIVSLSLVALIFAMKTAEKMESEVEKYYSPNNESKGLSLMYKLSEVIFIQDMIIFLVFIFAIGLLLPIIMCRHIIKKYIYYRVLHKDYTPLPEPAADSVDYTSWWKFCAYSITFPLCCFLNHINYIIIAFVHDLYHATSAVVAYGVIIIFCYCVLNEITSIMHEYRKKKNGWKCVQNNNLLAVQVILFLTIIVLLVCYVASDVALYFCLPINDAFEDAPNHFISIYQTAIIFLTALVSYVILLKPFVSPIHIFSKAVDSLLLRNDNYSVLGIAKKDWKGWSKNEKDVEVAKSLVKMINPLKVNHQASLKQLGDNNKSVKIVSILK